MAYTRVQVPKYSFAVSVDGIAGGVVEVCDGSIGIAAKEKLGRRMWCPARRRGGGKVGLAYREEIGVQGENVVVLLAGC